MITVIIGIVVVIVIVCAIAGIYNNMVTKRNRIDNAWQNIDTQLQRRNDLIPNLVETVKGYAKHEQETLSAVISARNTAVKATTVPAGEDQKPMIEQCCEIVHKFNSVYGDTLVEPEIVLPQNAACLRLPGIDGKAKMSKSLGNCIYLSEEPEDIKKKVMSMYTDPNHLRVQDPGQVEGNPVFIYLDAFCRPEHFAEFWPEYQNLDEVKAHYQRGGLGDVKVKKFLNSVMQAELEPIRTRRKEWEQRLPEVVEILKEGSAYAEKTAAATLADVRRSMRIDYFDNDNLLK